MQNYLNWVICTVKENTMKIVPCVQTLSKTQNQDFEKDIVKVELLRQNNEDISKFQKLPHCGMNIRTNNLLAYCEKNAIQNEQSVFLMQKLKIPKNKSKRKSTLIKSDSGFQNLKIT